MSRIERGFAIAIAVPFAIGFSVADAEPGDGEEVCRFQDPQIVESSGLVARDGLFATVNDSGDSARVFMVDAGTCRTVGVTSWNDDVEDVEAVAPYLDRLLVGDIGDNEASRESVRLYEVPAGRGDRAVEPVSHEITYPDGPRDAEALLVNPVSQRVFIASKGLMSGVLYLVPGELSATEPTRVRALADVPGLVTDGAFLPDGRHLVLRTYSRAVFYSYPELEVVGEVDLPDQQQGEGIAVDRRGRVFLSSEGQQAPVLRLELPRRLEQDLTPVSLPPGSGPTVPDSSVSEPDPERPVWPWLLGGAFGLGVIVVLLRALRPR
jgi:hypothetical protein